MDTGQTPRRGIQVSALCGSQGNPANSFSLFLLTSLLLLCFWLGSATGRQCEGWADGGEGKDWWKVRRGGKARHEILPPLSLKLAVTPLWLQLPLGQPRFSCGKCPSSLHSTSSPKGGKHFLSWLISGLPPIHFLSSLLLHHLLN